MKEELQNKLFEAGPILYSLRSLPETEALMCWGICCPNEWFEPLLELTKTLEEYSRKHEEHPILATQVKIKFRGLRFYVRFDPENNDFARERIDHYESTLFFGNPMQRERITRILIDDESGKKLYLHISYPLRNQDNLQDPNNHDGHEKAQKIIKEYELKLSQDGSVSVTE